VTSVDPVLLVIDDEPGTLALVDRIVQSTGFKTIMHTSAREALDRLPLEPVDLALIDLQMPELGGLDVLREIRRVQPQCGVILMTAQASCCSALDAVKLGALDYLTKPLDVGRLQHLLSETREEARRRTELLAAENETAHRLELCGMIGRSAIMQQLFGLVRRIAPHAQTALITGEKGAGKEAVARAIHDLGPGRGMPFVTVACADPVERAFEYHVFEAAGGGTLFLEEVSALRPQMQAGLVEILEKPKSVPARIIASTRRDLRPEAEAGRFSGALLYRLNIVQLHVPPLRERREDIPYLTAAFVKEFAGRFAKPLAEVSAGAERVLMTGEWLGNVRELRSVLEHACTLAEGRVLTERDVDAAMPPVRQMPPPLQPVPASPLALNALEREHIIRVLGEVRGNKRVAAQRLGISRRTLYRRLERHGLMTMTRAIPPAAQ